ncbi:hypothetical protein DOE73_16365 [Paenibacillus dendritiformis]|nr:hypothetical protein DOE73_16365 [Paenibacillus dendritiformis]
MSFSNMMSSGYGVAAAGLPIICSSFLSLDACIASGEADTALPGKRPVPQEEAAGIRQETQFPSDSN